MPIHFSTRSRSLQLLSFLAVARATFFFFFFFSSLSFEIGPMMDEAVQRPDASSTGVAIWARG